MALALGFASALASALTRPGALRGRGRMGAAVRPRSGGERGRSVPRRLLHERELRELQERRDCSGAA